LWIVLHDLKAPQKQSLGEVAMGHVQVIATEFVKRLALA
jgi:hypothetical protein